MRKCLSRSRRIAMARIIDIEGIGPKYAEILQNIGVRSTERLLLVASHKLGRQDLAAQTNIPEKLILEWVNLADLIRIKGIGEEYSDLLEEAGVDTIKELRNRNAKNLYEKIKLVNSEKRLVRRLPSQKDVETWIKEAKVLKPLVTY
jgi:predicted flap endonuclease-1-like 5' DNA nuclease